jgi:hypothetical protein
MGGRIAWEWCYRKPSLCDVRGSDGGTDSGSTVLHAAYHNSRFQQRMGHSRRKRSIEQTQLDG